MLHRSKILRLPSENEPGCGSGHLPAFVDITYRGERTVEGGHRVWAETKTDPDLPLEKLDLPLRLDVRSHSPTGFEWGYGGSGPAQLALALLLDALGDRELAERHYQEFKRVVVATWADRWHITAEEIRFFVLERATHKYRPGPARFQPGRLAATPGILREVPQTELIYALRRHLSGDWGELDAHDWQVNEDALKEGSRLLSAYFASNGTKYWIITESDRSVTTSLLPEEY